jgi:hypothetical protein
MRTLWPHLANLRAGSSGIAASAPSHEEVRRVVSEIDSLTTAVRDVERLTPPADVR